MPPPPGGASGDGAAAQSLDPVFLFLFFVFFNLWETGQESPSPGFQTSPPFLLRPGASAVLHDRTAQGSSLEFSEASGHSRWAFPLGIPAGHPVTPASVCLSQLQGFPSFKKGLSVPQAQSDKSDRPHPLSPPIPSPLFLLAGLLGGMTSGDLGRTAVGAVLSRAAPARRL